MSPRGGARAGAGRPKGEETKVMRIPVGKIRDVMEVLEGESYDIPMFSGKVQAGVPEMADDYIEGMVNLNNLLIPNPGKTFFVRATGDSMIDVGIHSNDTLIVDRSVKPLFTARKCTIFPHSRYRRQRFLYLGRGHQ